MSAAIPVSLLKRTDGRPILTTLVRQCQTKLSFVLFVRQCRYACADPPTSRRFAGPRSGPADRPALPGNIQSIERAATILRLLSGRNRRLGVVDIAGEMGLSKGTVHGLLRTLQSVGFVEQDEDSGKYRLGAALLHMGSSYLDGNELRTRALNWSDSLATRTREAVRIGTLHDGQVLVVHHVFRPDDTLQTLDVGSLLPVHATALGKVLLAHHPYVASAVAANGLEAYTNATITDADRLMRELDRVRAQGWAARRFPSRRR